MGVGLYTTSFANVFYATNSTVGSYKTLDPTLFPLESSDGKIPDALIDNQGVIAGPSLIDPDHLMSVTLPIFKNTTLITQRTPIGYITLVLSTQSIQTVLKDRTGLESTGKMSLLETVPNYLSNHSYTHFRYVLPPEGNNEAGLTRWGDYPLKEYPAVQAALSGNSSGVLSDTRDVSNETMAVGFSSSDVQFATWIITVDEPESHIYSPIHRLKVIVISLSFGLAVFIVLITVPVAHFAVQPIYRLLEGTEQTRMEFYDGKYDDDSLKSIGPKNPVLRLFYNVGQHVKQWFTVRGYGRGVKPASGDGSGGNNARDINNNNEDSNNNNNTVPTTASTATCTDNQTCSEEIKTPVSATAPDTETQEKTEETDASNSTKVGVTNNRKNTQDDRFKVPNHVRVPRKFFRDELTDLCETFNELADELVKQYLNLEDRVAERTKEMEQAKTAAVLANEAKSLFIANITHELRTPLNGILGMTAVSMTEKDLAKVKRSLLVIYKSGELLLNLLNDLLTFSKNQIGSLQLDEKEFMLREVYTNIRQIFSAQAKERNIKFTVDVPAESSAMMMVLYGDSSRILQIMINLISNAIKFTPRGGHVAVKLRNLGDVRSAAASTAAAAAAVTSNRSINNGSVLYATSTGVSASRSSSRRGGAPGTSEGQVQGQFFGHRHHSSINKMVTDNEEQGANAASANERLRQGSISSRGSIIGSLRQLSIVTSNNNNNSNNVNNNSSSALNRAIYDLPRDLLFEFEVEDDGPGISDELRDRIFEPFVQGDQALSKKHGGTGLGLSICKQLAQLMGGEIVLKTVVGKGSTFIVQIPLKHTRTVAPNEDNNSASLSRNNSLVASPATMTTTNSPAQDAVISPLSEIDPNSKEGLERNDSVGNRSMSESGGYFSRPGAAVTTGTSATPGGHMRSGSSSSMVRMDNIRVLVAEDNVVNQEIMKRMLRLEGINDISIALDGEEVVAKVEDAIKEGVYYDIVFMDIQMPKLNGLDATKFMRGTLGYPYTIIAMTAYADKKSENDCIEAGMNGVITKPILRKSLHKLLLDYCPGAPLHEPALTPDNQPSETGSSKPSNR